jgi:hypothetical protein
MENPRIPVYPHGYVYGDDLLRVGGYGAGYGYWFALLGTGLGRQNPCVLYPLTSLRRRESMGSGVRQVNYLGIFGGTDTFGGTRKKTGENYLSFDSERWADEI